MSRSGITLLVLAVITAGVAGHGWRETEKARAAAIAAENAIFRNVGMDGEMKQIQKHLLAVERDRDQLRAALDAAGAGPLAASAPATKAGQASAPVGIARLEDALVRRKATRPGASGFLSENPELRGLFRESRRASLAAAYGPFLRTVELAPAQIEQFNELCLRREEQRMDLEEGDRSADPTEKAAGTMIRAGDEAAFRAAQLALLGEKGFQQFQEFERERPVRTVVTQLAGAAALADLALTPQQGEQLVRVLARTSSSYQTGGPADPGQVDWPAVDTEARRILSPDQFNLFTRVEPLGGGPSRFEAKLLREVAAADQKDRATMPFR